MRVIEIQTEFGLDHLVAADRPVPEPRPRQVLLRMRAVALNYRDLLTVGGVYNPKQPLPLIPCSDGVGEVAAVGTDVERVREGDRVIPIFAQRWIGGEPTRGSIADDAPKSEKGLLRQRKGDAGRRCRLGSPR